MSNHKGLLGWVSQSVCDFYLYSSCDLTLGYLSSLSFVAGFWWPCFCLLIQD